MTKYTRIEYEFDIQAGVADQQVRYFVRSVEGIEYPNDKVIQVPKYDRCAGSKVVLDSEVGNWTEQALLAEIQRKHGPDASMASVKHVTFYE